MGTITLTNIPQFVESPGRSITKTVGALDRMTVPFIGPYYAEIPFYEGHPDTIYPLMFCTGWTDTRNGALKELRVNYAGRTDIKAGSFVSEAFLSYSESEKELSYSELSVQETYQHDYGGAAGVLTVFRTATVNYVLRYISRQVSFKYCSYPNAYVIPVGIGDLAPSIISQYIRFTGNGSVTYSLAQPNSSLLAEQYPGPFGYVGPVTREVNFRAEQAIGGWYECTITYDARYENTG